MRGATGFPLCEVSIANSVLKPKPAQGVFPIVGLPQQLLASREFLAWIFFVPVSIFLTVYTKATPLPLPCGTCGEPVARLWRAASVPITKTALWPGPVLWGSLWCCGVWGYPRVCLVVPGCPLRLGSWGPGVAPPVARPGLIVLHVCSRVCVPFRCVNAPCADPRGTCGAPPPLPPFRVPAPEPPCALPQLWQTIVDHVADPYCFLGACSVSEGQGAWRGMGRCCTGP